jgi:hypothetical protein
MARRSQQKNQRRAIVSISTSLHAPCFRPDKRRRIPPTVAAEHRNPISAARFPLADSAPKALSHKALCADFSLCEWSLERLLARHPVFH